MEYYSAIRSNAVLIYADMNLEHIMLNKISQTQKDKYRYYSIVMKCLEWANS